ncbi:MAG: LPXTG cell wall anchor domain-containing protein [Janthinobacterium lividum]
MHHAIKSSTCRLVLFASLFSAAPIALHAAAAPGSSKVVYVAGDSLVVNRVSDGITYRYKVQPSTQVTTDGGSVAVSSLKPGSMLTGTPAGTANPVDDASVVSGKVVSVNPPNTLLVSVAGENKQVIIPSGTVSSGGKDVPITGVKAGDEVQLTMVVVRAEGDNRPLSAVKTPAQQGTLALFMEPNMEMPDTGTNLPLYGVAGAALLALGYGLKRRSAA